MYPTINMKFMMALGVQHTINPQQIISDVTTALRPAAFTLALDAFT